MPENRALIGISDFFLLFLRDPGGSSPKSEALNPKL